MILKATAALILVTYIFGALYAINCNAIRRCMIGVFDWKIFSLFGIIGVPFHELSHFLTALIFGHDITAFALYRPFAGRKDGCLGYVRHKYNKRSPYQRVGNFFIGAAPMIFGAILLTILFQLAVPGTEYVNITDIGLFFESMASLTESYYQSLIECDKYSIALIIAIFLICPHICMSKADFKNTVSGTLTLLLLAYFLPIVLRMYFGISISLMEKAVLYFFMTYFYVLFIGFIFTTICAIVLRILYASRDI